MSIEYRYLPSKEGFSADCADEIARRGRALVWTVAEKHGPVSMVLPGNVTAPAFGLGVEEYPQGAWRVSPYDPETGDRVTLPGPLADCDGAVIDGCEVTVLDS